MNDVDWDPTGLRLVTGSSDQRLLTWSVLESPTFHRISLGNSKASAITWYADSSRLTCTTDDRLIATIDTGTRKVVKSPQQDGLENKKSKDMGKYLDESIADRISKNKQFFFDMNNEGILWSGDESKVGVVFSLKGVSMFRNLKNEFIEPCRSIEIWNIHEKKRVVDWHVFTVSDAQWASDHRRLVVGGTGDPNGIKEQDNAGWVYIFDAVEGKKLHKLRHGSFNEQVTAVGWHPSGTQIVAGNMTGLCCIWNATDGKLLRALDVHQAQIHSLAWSPDAKRIASADSRGQVKILDAGSLEELFTLREGDGGVRNLAWSPDGSQLAGVHSSGSVMLWNASRGFSYSNSDAFKKRITSQNSEALMAKAIFYHEKDDSGAVIVVLDQLLQADRDNVRALVIRGHNFYKTARFSLAIADLKRAVELVPSHQTAWYWLGNTQTRLGLYDDAIASLTISVDASLESSDIPRKSRADAYILRGDIKQGQSELQLLSDKNLVGDASRSLSLLYNSRGESKSNAELCKRILEHIEKKNTSTYEILQGCWICCLTPNSLDDYERLLSALKKIPEHSVQRHWYNLILGAVLFRAGEYEQAREHLQLSPSLGDNHSGDDTNAYYFLALTQIALGHKDLASESLVKARSTAEKHYLNGIPPDWHSRQLLETLESEAMSLLQP